MPLNVLDLSSMQAINDDGLEEPNHDTFVCVEDEKPLYIANNIIACPDLERWYIGPYPEFITPSGIEGDQTSDFYSSRLDVHYGAGSDSTTEGTINGWGGATERDVLANGEDYYYMTYTFSYSGPKITFEPPSPTMIPEKESTLNFKLRAHTSGVSAGVRLYKYYSDPLYYPPGTLYESESNAFELTTDWQSFTIDIPRILVGLVDSCHDEYPLTIRFWTSDSVEVEVDVDDVFIGGYEWVEYIPG